MSVPNTPRVVLCPRCFCPLDANRTYSVDLLVPLHHLPLPIPNPPADGVPPNQNPVTNPTPVQPPTPQPDEVPVPPDEASDTSSTESEEYSTPSPTESERNEGSSDGDRRSSSSSMNSVFTQFVIDADFVEQLQAFQDSEFSQRPFQPPRLLRSSPHPMDTSPDASPSPEPMPSSPPEESTALPTEPTPTPSTEPTPTPSTESTTTPSAESNTAPSTGPSSTASASNESPTTIRRWVVFRGRRPDIYTTPEAAIAQTTGFPNSLMLAFNNTAVAEAAWERFYDEGAVPAHGRGPWVVFIGRQRGVFTSYEELCASVVGYPNNLHRCCESVEEGNRALVEWLARFPTPGAAERAVSGSAHHDRRLVLFDTSDDDSWWCCFTGRNPGVYQGLGNLVRAYPEPGGVRRANTEEAARTLLAKYARVGQVRKIPPPQ